MLGAACTAWLVTHYYSIRWSDRVVMCPLSPVFAARHMVNRCAAVRPTGGEWRGRGYQKNVVRNGCHFEPWARDEVSLDSANDATIDCEDSLTILLTIPEHGVIPKPQYIQGYLIHSALIRDSIQQTEVVVYRLDHRCLHTINIVRYVRYGGGDNIDQIAIERGGQQAGDKVFEVASFPV